MQKHSDRSLTNLMDNILVIFGCIALGSLTVLCVTLTFVAVGARKDLGKMTITMEHVGRDVGELKDRALPLFDQTSTVLRITEVTLEKLDDDLDRLSRGAQLFESAAREVKNLQTLVVDKIRAPINDITSLFSGAIRGFSEFTKTILDK